MMTRFGMAPRRSGTTIEEFQAHWRTRHADVASGISNVTRYVQNHGILSGGRYLLGYPGFDACSQIDFESVAAVEEGFASGFYRESVTWDERAFVDKSRFSLVVGQPLVVRAGEERGVKLLSFLRLHPGS